MLPFLLYCTLLLLYYYCIIPSFSALFFRVANKKSSNHFLLVFPKNMTFGREIHRQLLLRSRKFTFGPPSAPVRFATFLIEAPQCKIIHIYVLALTQWRILWKGNKSRIFLPFVHEGDILPYLKSNLFTLPYLCNFLRRKNLPPFCRRGYFYYVAKTQLRIYCKYPHIDFFSLVRHAFG